MKSYLLIFLLSTLTLSFATPIVVPQEFYVKWPKIDEHSGFAPFISHVNFRHMADFAIDQSAESFDPDLVQPGDIIYINVWFLQWFEEKVHDLIKHPYILVSCDVGDRIPDHPGSFNKLLYDPKCAAWYCRNIVFSYHKKLQQIPWGQDLWQWGPNAIDDLKNSVKYKPFEKKHLLYMNHYPRPFGDRDKIAKLFEHAPFCFSRNCSSQPTENHVFIPRPQFYEEIGSSVFTLSPLGLETDSVRTWEAFALDSIPIVEHTFLDPQYDGMPIVIVYDWTEITEEFLLAKKEELKGKSTEKAYFNYWHQLIKDRQKEIRNGDLFSSSLEASLFGEEELQTLASILKKQESQDLIYRGFLATLRPFQLANSFDFLNNIFFYDPWLHEQTWQRFILYMRDFSLLKNMGKIVALSSESRFNDVMQFYPYSSVFLDLTYYRTGLVLNRDSYRHSLKRDIRDLYDRMQKGALLCGNMARDDYVLKVLNRLEHDDGLPIKIEGNFWSIIKQ